MMVPPVEAILEALLALVTGPPAVCQVTASLVAGDPTLYGVSASDAANLLPGMPLFGPGLQVRAAVGTLAPALTMTQPAEKSLSSVRLTQGFRMTGRKVPMWADISEPPAVFVRAGNQHVPNRPSGQFAAEIIEAEIWIYSQPYPPPLDGTADTELNALVSAVRQLLEPEPVTNVQSLGGLVSHCWIEGDVIVDQGDIDGQGKVILPVRMEFPPLG